jgi:hypothetical protein
MGGRHASYRANPGRPLLLAYSVTCSRRWKSVYVADNGNGAECLVCVGEIMAMWGSTDVPTFTLIQRPEDAA